MQTSSSAAASTSGPCRSRRSSLQKKCRKQKGLYCVVLIPYGGVIDHHSWLSLRIPCQFPRAILSLTCGIHATPTASTGLPEYRLVSHITRTIALFKPRGCVITYFRLDGRVDETKCLTILGHAFQSPFIGQPANAMPWRSHRPLDTSELWISISI